MVSEKEQDWVDQEVRPGPATETGVSFQKNRLIHNTGNRWVLTEKYRKGQSTAEHTLCTCCRWKAERMFMETNLTCE